MLVSSKVPPYFGGVLENPIKLPISWEKIKKYSLRAGKEVAALAEATYRTLKDPSVSWKQKGLLVAALVYLVSPLDGVPDFLPGGYLDDISLLLGTLLGVGRVGRQHLSDCRKEYGLKPEKYNVAPQEDQEAPTMKES